MKKVWILLIMAMLSPSFPAHGAGDFEQRRKLERVEYAQPGTWIQVECSDEAPSRCDLVVSLRGTLHRIGQDKLPTARILPGQLMLIAPENDSDRSFAFTVEVECAEYRDLGPKSELCIAEMVMQGDTLESVSVTKLITETENVSTELRPPPGTTVE